MRIGQKLSLPLLFLIFSNLITAITIGATLIEYIKFIGFFVIIMLLLFFIKKELINKIAVSWLVLLFSLVAEFILYPTDLTGISLFILSLTISKKSKKSYIIYISLFFIIMLYKFNEINMKPSQIMAYISGISFSLIIYQHYIHPKKHNNPIDYSKKVIEKLQIDNTVCLIMIDYVKGYGWDDISKNLKLNVTGDRVQRIVKKEMTEKGYHNYADLCCYLTDVGIIKAIDKNLITE